MSTLPDPKTTIEVTVEDVDALAEAIGSGEIILLDCREEDEWEINRLPHARLTPLSRFATAAAEALGDGNAPCIIYCHHGMRSMRATEWLRSHGHDQAWSMKGGIHAWSETIDSDIPQY